MNKKAELIFDSHITTTVTTSNVFTATQKMRSEEKENVEKGKSMI